MAGELVRTGKKKTGERKGSSPRCEAVGAQEAGGGAASREIEAAAAGSRRRKRSTARSDGEQEAPGRRVPMLAAHTTREDEEDPRGCTPTIRGLLSAGSGAAAGVSGGSTCTRMKRCGVCSGAERARQGLDHDLYRSRSDGRKS
jgi:hypothetical protein